MSAFRYWSEDEGLSRGVLILRLGPQKISRGSSHPSREGRRDDTSISGRPGLSHAFAIRLERVARDFFRQRFIPKRPGRHWAANREQEYSGDYTGKNGPQLILADRSGRRTKASGLTSSGWSLPRWIPSEAFAPGPFTANADMAGLPSCIALVSFIVAYLLSGTVTKPLSMLAEKVVHVGKGDLTTEIPWQTRNDEIGTLGQGGSRYARRISEARRSNCWRGWTW